MATMNANHDIAQTRARIKTILRRDLKLGDQSPIDDNMPLSGGEFDLDSLDILLIVTSVEKEFGIKIPNESVGRAAFANVDTLSRFVESRRQAPAP